MPAGDRERRAVQVDSGTGVRFTVRRASALRPGGRPQAPEARLVADVVDERDRRGLDGDLAAVGPARG